jgi:hypothetical protein
MPIQFLTRAESGAATIAPVLLRLFRHALSLVFILLRHDARSADPLGNEAYTCLCKRQWSISRLVSLPLAASVIGEVSSANDMPAIYCCDL